MLRPLGMTYRRALLDSDLMRVGRMLRGRVLDVGGRRQNRGHFTPPAGAVCIRLNIDPAADADIIADAQALPVRSGAADCVLCLEMLEYVDAPEVATAEMSRVLRPGGHALLSAPFLHRADSITDRHRFTARRLRELLERAGLVVVEIIPQGHFFGTLANILRQGTAAVRSRPARWALAMCAIPLGTVLLWLDRRRGVRQSEFLSSFTTGYLAVAVKPSQGPGAQTNS